MTRFITEFFGKSISEISIDDIKELFNTPQTETATLEFKSGEVDIIKLYREITALHNTDGGLLILGAPREEKKKCCGELRPSKLTRLALAQGIGTNIVPPPIGIQIHPIPYNDGNVYLIDVPKSSNPPHQYQGCYYVRFDEESRAAPHGFVEALFNRRKLPDLRSTIKIISMPHNHRLMQLNVIIFNESVIPAKNVYYSIQVIGDTFDFDSVENFSAKTATGYGDIIIKEHWVLKKGEEPSLVRSLQYSVKIRLATSDNARYIMFIVGIWSDQNDMRHIVKTFDTVSQLFVLESIHEGGNDVGALMNEFYALELNRPQADVNPL